MNNDKVIPLNSMTEYMDYLSSGNLLLPDHEHEILDLLSHGLEMTAYQLTVEINERMWTSINMIEDCLKRLFDLNLVDSYLGLPVTRWDKFFDGETGVKYYRITSLGCLVERPFYFISHWITNPEEKARVIELYGAHTERGGMSLWE